MPCLEQESPGPFADFEQKRITAIVSVLRNLGPFEFPFIRVKWRRLEDDYQSLLLIQVFYIDPVNGLVSGNERPDKPGIRGAGMDE